jgi:ribose/xylose/arabinose/galactoside ABC-type transport system permease subunit
MITKMKIPPIVVTIATMAAYRGLANGLGGGRGITNFPEKFQTFGQGSLFNLIPYSAFVMVLVVVFGYIIMERSKLGRYITSIGYNETGAYYSGVKVNRIKLMLYIFSGMMAGLAGIIYTARLGAAKANAFTGGELEVVTAVVLGGTSVTGGENNIVGTIIGVLIITFLKNGLNLARVPHSVQTMLIGIILISAIVVYSRIRNIPFREIVRKSIKP